jgi:hypothetical protein
VGAGFVYQSNGFVSGMNIKLSVDVIHMGFGSAAGYVELISDVGKDCSLYQ